MAASSMTLGRIAGIVLALVATTRPAAARPRAPETVTVGAGATLPLFLIYEYPGPWAQVAAAWPLTAHTEVVATADTGLMFAPGIRRYLGSLGVGGRVRPWRCGPLWLQLGLGVTGYVERIGVTLPARQVRATDAGGMLTVDLALGVRVARWELAVGYDHLLWGRTGSDEAPADTGEEVLSLVGTAMAWIGREL